EYDFSEAYTPIYNNDDTNILAELNLMPQSYVVVHPGMRGSALNWPPECYIEFIKQLEKDQTIVITGTDSDWPYIEPLFQEFNQQPHFKWLNGKLSADELIAVLQNAKVVMAPSTGVIHLAASSGVPCVGIYPPIKVQSKKRWGAIGPKAINLEAEENKNLKNPMSGLSPQLVYNSVKQYL
ncbi:MAG: hypothetical protein KDD50_09985, partial [Bdellovibrionales bacterium]|nr:hypothetical protein [Bdellovibrionales bacterium]